MRAVVTGAGGFVGRPLVRRLRARGWDVHAVDRAPRSAGFDDVPRHACDLLAEGAGALLADLRPDLLVHLAWEATPGRFWTAVENLDWVAATLRLVRAFAAAGGRRAVIAGSCAEYDWSQPLLSEATTPLRPATLYGTAKAATFTLLEAAAPRLGVEIAWARLFFLYGPGEPPGKLVGDVAGALLAGRPAECSEGRQCRDYMHVDDVAAALAVVAASDHRGPVNIASGCCVPVAAIVDEIARQTGRADLVRRGARPTPPGDPARLEADIGTLRRLGFTPRFDLAAGITDTLAWIRRERNGGRETASRPPNASLS